MTELVLKLVFDGLKISFGFLGDVISLAFAHKPLLLWSTLDVISVLDQILTSLELFHRLLHFSFLLKLALYLGDHFCQLACHGCEDWLHELVLDREGIHVLVELTAELLQVLSLFLVAECDGDTVLACSGGSSDPV